MNLGNTFSNAWNNKLDSILDALGFTKKRIRSSTEYLTGERWVDGRPIYARDFHTTVAMSVNINYTLITIDTSLEVTNLSGLAKTALEWRKLGNTVSTSQVGSFSYKHTTGIVDARLGGGAASTEQNFTVEYVKP